jgi:hypothetical protein
MSLSNQAEPDSIFVGAITGKQADSEKRQDKTKNDLKNFIFS